jgi:hypothetical protein
MAVAFLLSITASLNSRHSNRATDPAISVSGKVEEEQLETLGKGRIFEAGISVGFGSEFSSVCK